MGKFKVVGEKYIVKEEDGIVITFIDDHYSDFKGIARCHEEDEFSEEFGKALAKAKAVKLGIQAYVDDRRDAVDYYEKRLNAAKAELETLLNQKEKHEAYLNNLIDSTKR